MTTQFRPGDTGEQWQADAEPGTKRHRTIKLSDLPLGERRALVEAGYAPLPEYLARLEAVECGGCAAPVLVEPLQEDRCIEPSPRSPLAIAVSVLLWAVLIFAFIEVVAVFGSRA